MLSHIFLEWFSNMFIPDKPICPHAKEIAKNAYSSIADEPAPQFLLSFVWLTYLQLGERQNNMERDTVPVLDVVFAPGRSMLKSGDTPHIQQLLASQVAQQHGIDMAQSLERLESLGPWLDDFGYVIATFLPWKTHKCWLFAL